MFVSNRKLFHRTKIFTVIDQNPNRIGLKTYNCSFLVLPFVTLPISSTWEMFQRQRLGSLQEFLWWAFYRQLLWYIRVNFFFRFILLKYLVFVPLIILLHQLHPPFHTLNSSKKLRTQHCNLVLKGIPLTKYNVCSY